MYACVIYNTAVEAVEVLFICFFCKDSFGKADTWEAKVENQDLKCDKAAQYDRRT